jgi:hypothetical protein
MALARFWLLLESLYVIVEIQGLNNPCFDRRCNSVRPDRSSGTQIFFIGSNTEGLELNLFVHAFDFV